MKDSQRAFAIDLKGTWWSICRIHWTQFTVHGIFSETFICYCLARVILTVVDSTRLPIWYQARDLPILLIIFPDLNFKIACIYKAIHDYKQFFYGGGGDTSTCTFNGMHCGSYNLREFINTRLNQVVWLACFNIFRKHMLTLLSIRIQTQSCWTIFAIYGQGIQLGFS